MRILILTDGIFPFAMGGMQKHSTFLAKYLSENNCTIDIAHCVYQNTKLPSKTELEQVLGHQVHSILSLSFPKSFKFPGHYLLNSYRYSKQLFRFYSNKWLEYDLIYAQGFTSWYFLKQKAKLKPPVYVNLHGLEMYQASFSLKEKIQKFLLRIPSNFILSKADFVQSLGGKLNDILEKRLNSSKVIERGIGIGDFWSYDFQKNQNNILNFVFVGRNEYRKGLHILNEVLNSSKMNFKDFVFHFIGPIPENQQLKGEKYVFHGSINDEQKIKNILLTCDVLVLPSLSEGMPTVILEAMACSCGIIATNVGAVKSLVGSDNGIVIDAASKNQLSEALIKTLNMTQQEIEALKWSSHQKVNAFLWGNQIKNYIKDFKRIINC